MIVNYQPLSFWVKKLRDGEHFSMVKHSDASLYCMRGDKGGDCNGCEYTPALRGGLIDSMRMEIGDYQRAKVDYPAPYYRGIQRLTDRDREGMDVFLRSLAPTFGAGMWWDTGFLPEALRDGGLYPLVEQLRKMKVVMVTNARVLEQIAARKILPLTGGVSYVVPESNALTVREEVVRGILSAAEPAVYLFGCGMAGSVFVSDLHGRIPRSTLWDTGHIWDALTGNRLRHYLTELTDDHLARNLRPADVPPAPAPG